MDIYRDGELFLYGYVGESYWDEGFTDAEVLTALATHGRDNDLTVHINSGGGRVDHGIAIYNALASHKGQVRVEVDAVALSAASLIAMAGDTIVMRAGALMMIHDPLTITLGNSADHSKSVEQLEAFATQMAGIYAERSDKAPEAARDVMRAETWMTSEQAVAQGFADEAEAAKSKASASFDYTIYAKAPGKLKTLARKKGWSIETVRPEPEAAENPPANPEDQTVTTNNPTASAPTPATPTAADIAAATTAAVQADRDRRRSILALDEAKDRAGLASHLADNTTLDLDAVKATLASAPKASGTVDPAAYEAARQSAPGGDGLQGGNPPVADAGKSAWKRAADRINARFG